MIRKAKETDAHAIALIYNHYIVHSTTTFEEKEVNGQLILERLNKNKNTRGGFTNKRELFWAMLFPQSGNPDLRIVLPLKAVCMLHLSSSKRV